MPEYNVLSEPWIPVRMLTGEEKEVGILELLENAHLMQCVSDPSPLFEYGIYRLLTVFLMDAFRPEIQADIEDMLAAGAFDMERIFAYIRECEKEGPCFDLFDAKRPFLQSAYDEKWDKTIKPVALLLHNIPSGNNHIHFLHGYEGRQTFCPSVCVKALCTVNVFCTAGLQGPSSVNGAPPIYVMIRGENLFEGLLLNCIPSTMTQLKYGYPVWRYGTEVEPGKRMSEISLLEGMTLMARRCHLIPDENGGVCTYSGERSPVVVSKMHFQKGLNFEGYDSWRDPHVAYSISDKGRSSIKPQLGKEMWRNIGSIFGDDQKSPDVVRQYVDLLGARMPMIPVVTYGLMTNQAQYESWSRDEVSLDMDIVKNSSRMWIIGICIEHTENVARELRRSLRTISHKAGEDIVEQSLGQFFARSRQEFFSELCRNVARVDIKDNDAVNGVIEQWNKALKNYAMEEFDACADRLGLDGKDLMGRMKAQISLLKGLAKLLGKEEKK